MIFYSGAGPAMEGKLCIGSMILQHVTRLVMEKDHITHEERLLIDRKLRIREVQPAPPARCTSGIDGGLIAGSHRRRE